MEPTEEEVVAAVVSLCEDQLRPYGRILKKRLQELCPQANSSPPEMELARLRAVCERCSQLRVEPEGQIDWSAVPVAGAPKGFVDIYCAPDDYGEEFWWKFAKHLAKIGDDEMSCPGGRYVCAQALASRRLPFLNGYSLGQISHIVQLAMTRKRLLGYRNGAIVPYARSQTMVKVQCAEQGQLCRKTKLPVASWETLRACLRDLLDNDHGACEVGIPLSNVKRALRASFKVDLSETALGHATVSELFKDHRLQDMCSLRLHEKGYFVFASHSQALQTAQLVEEREVDPMSSNTFGVPYNAASNTPNSPPSMMNQSFLSASAFSTTPMMPVSTPPGFELSMEAWDLTCNALGITPVNASTPASSPVRNSPMTPFYVAGCEASPCRQVLSTVPQQLQENNVCETPMTPTIRPLASYDSFFASDSLATPRLTVEPTPSPTMVGRESFCDRLMRATTMECSSPNPDAEAASSVRTESTAGDDISSGGSDVATESKPPSPRQEAAETPSAFTFGCDLALQLRRKELSEAEKVQVQARRRWTDGNSTMVGFCSDIAVINTFITVVPNAPATTSIADHRAKSVPRNVARLRGV
jgi:hypothetical protein